MGVCSILVVWLLSNTRLGHMIKKYLRLEIPKSPLPDEFCPSCCHLQGEKVLVMRAMKSVIEKHYSETPKRQGELVEALSSAIVAALHDVSVSDRTPARELMNDNLQGIKSLRSEVQSLGGQLQKLVDLVEGKLSNPRQSSDGANPGDHHDYS
ncbi:hypothetical protein F4777DRAFT_575888 [Nemania sp. FL0916]|nr:hypothetical protein F4777DRAFT_575888 [Nemania sp. FL0916]